MAYREAARANPAFPRKRPSPAFVLHRPAAWAVVAASLVLAGFALFFAPLASGAQVECVRAAPNTTPACRLRNTIALSSGEARFEGSLGALSVLVQHRIDDKGDAVETRLQANGFTTRMVSEPEARATVDEYAAFVSDPGALAFRQRIPAPSSALAIAIMCAVLAVGLGVVGVLMERAQRLVIDAEVDELVVERVSFARRLSVTVHPLSKIEHVVVEAAYAKNMAYDLSIVMAGARHFVFQAGPSECQRAAALIRERA